MTRQKATLHWITSFAITTAVTFSPLWDRIGAWRTIGLALCLSLLASEYIDYRTAGKKK